VLPPPVTHYYISAITILSIIWGKSEWDSSTSKKISIPPKNNAKPICLFLQSGLLVPETARPYMPEHQKDSACKQSDGVHTAHCSFIACICY